MVKPFEYFMNGKLVRRSSKNKGLARSLMQKAQVRLRLSKKVDEESASLVFEDIYEALREAAQAIMEARGYKPYSHEALIAFLREYKVLALSQITILDNYRMLRNNSVYRAEKVSVGKCKEAIRFARKTLPVLQKRFEEILD